MVVTSGMYCIIHTGNPSYYCVHIVMPKLYGYFDTYILGEVHFCAVNMRDTQMMRDLTTGCADSIQLHNALCTG